MKNIPLGSRVSVVLALSLIVYSGAAVSRLNGQTIDTGFVYGGAAFENRLDGAGRFGAGLDFRLAPQFDLGGELGAIFKNDVGILASANLTYHFTRPNRRKERGMGSVFGRRSFRRPHLRHGWVLCQSGRRNKLLVEQSLGAARGIQGIPRRTGPGRIRRIPLRRHIPALSRLEGFRGLSSSTE